VYPSGLIFHAAMELSTPPLIAISTFVIVEMPGKNTSFLPHFYNKTI
jgi:hypothetical protein